jgi:hypothetical protein
MTPEQLQQFIIANEKSTAEAIEKTVNGKIRAIHLILEKQNEKIDSFHTKVEKHIQVVEPYITGVETVTRVGSFSAKALMWIGGFILTVGGAYVFIKNNIFK